MPEQPVESATLKTPSLEEGNKEAVMDKGEIQRLVDELERGRQDIGHLKAELEDKHQILMDSNRRVRELEAEISTGKHTIIVEVPVIL